MNIVELTGADLDYWAARAEGYAAELVELYGWRYCRIDVYGVGWRQYEPTQNEGLAARLMHSRFYTIGPAPFDEKLQVGGAQRMWMAEAQMSPLFSGLQIDESPWVAICRLRVEEALQQNAALRDEYEQRNRERPHESKATGS